VDGRMDKRVHGWNNGRTDGEADSLQFTNDRPCDSQTSSRLTQQSRQSFLSGLYTTHVVTEGTIYY
jgi:hypothetical protein